VNQIDPSERTTTSLGLLSRLPSNESAITVIEPSCSVRVTRRLPCSQVTRRPCGSTVLPLELAAGERKTPTVPVGSSQRSIRSLGMSLQTR
jgi:hypothetical protein